MWELCGCVAGQKENNGVSLLHGEYNAEESAAAFQQALAEWRTAGKEASPRATGEAQASKGKASSGTHVLAAQFDMIISQNHPTRSLQNLPCFM